MLKPRALEVTGVRTSTPSIERRPRRVAAATAVAAATVLATLGFAAITMVPVSAEPQALRLPDPEHGPTPEPLRFTLADVSKAHAATAEAPPAPAPRLQLDPSAQVRRLVPRLRRCPSAPTGSVLVEVDDGLRRLDLIEVDPADRWHRCAASTLAAVTGTARVDLKL